MHKTLKASLIQLGVEVFFTLLIVWASFYGNFIETYYFNGFYRPFSMCLRYISCFFPFAFGNIIYGLFICFSIYFMVRTISKLWKQEIPWQVIPLKVINFILLLFIIFKLFWGLNYHRPPIAKKLDIKDEKYHTEELVALANYFLVKLNTLKPQIDSSKARPKQYHIAQLQKEALKTYHKLAAINNVFAYPEPCVKPCLFDNFITKSGIEGYYNPLSGEANINMKLVPFVLPFIVSHEIAHQTGIAKEDEANLIGYLVAINSRDINFRYAGYYSIFGNVLREIRLKSPENFELIVLQLDPSVKKDFDTEIKFWLKHNASLSKYMGTAFDKILKLNSQQKGIKSYQDIVLWLYNFHKDEF